MDMSGQTHNQTTLIHRMQGWVEHKVGLGIERGFRTHLGHIVVTALNTPFQLFITVTTACRANQNALNSYSNYFCLITK